MDNTTERKFVIIGISGVTNGGKTSLSRELKNVIGSNVTVINMDDYFRPEGHPNLIMIPELQHANWESLQAIDFETMHKDIKKWMKSPPEGTSIPVLLIEGIIVFNYKPLLPLFDKKFFLTLTNEQCWERRQTRTYEPADPEGYYEAVVWPMYLKNKAELKDEKDIIFIDGAINKEDILKMVLTNIKDVLVL